MKEGLTLLGIWIFTGMCWHSNTVTAVDAFAALIIALLLTLVIL